MRSSLTLIALALLSVMTFTDTASAGLFGRIRARRTAEMQAAVAGQVGAAAARLGANLDAQVAEESEKLDSQFADETQKLDSRFADETQKLDSRFADGAQKLDAQFADRATKLDEQLAVGGKKLDDQLTAGLAQLQQQAQGLLAAETKKLEQQLAEQIAKLQADAKQAVVVESTKLREEVEAKVAKLNASADAQIKDAIAKFDGDMSKGLKEAQEAALAARTASTDMQTAVRDEFEKLKTEVNDMVKNQLASSAAVPVPADEPEQTEAPPEENAIPSTASRLEEEKKS